MSIVQAKRLARRNVGIALVVSVATLIVAAPAGASLKEDLAPFADCPLETPKVVGCIVSVTTSGEFTIGNSTVPINQTITLQGGTVPPSQQLAPAADGNSLSKTPLVVPGGLLGIELLGNLTGVTATAELAGPPELSPGVILPLKVKLDNPLLGSACYIGSDSEPIVMHLNSGTTNPPPPNKPITGNSGTPDVKYQGQLIKVTNSSLVDNAFSVPGASGCAGVLAPVVDASVDSKEGLPAAAGHNTAILNGSLELAPAELVRNPPPEFGRCVKVAKNTGKYHTTSCAGGLAEGSYEWFRGVIKKGFTTSAGTTKLETVSKSKITCAAESGSGEYSGAKTVTGVTVTFTGCEGPGATKCATAGANEGELLTKPLEGQLGIISEEVKEGKEIRKIGLELFPAGHAGSYVEFSCGGSPQVLRGSVVAPVSIDKMSLTSTLTYKGAKGKQAPEQFEGEPRDVLESSVAGGTFEQSGLTLTATQTSEEPIEINAFL